MRVASEMFEVARWHKRELRAGVERWGGWDDAPKPDFKLEDTDDEEKAADAAPKSKLGKAAARAGRAAARHLNRAKTKVKKVKQMVVKSVKKILTRTVMHKFFKRKEKPTAAVPAEGTGAKGKKPAKMTPEEMAERTEAKAVRLRECVCVCVWGGVGGGVSVCKRVGVGVGVDTCAYERVHARVRLWLRKC